MQVVGLTKGLNNERFSSQLLTGHVGEHEADYLTLMGLNGALPVVRVRGLGRAVQPTDDLIALRQLILYIRRYRPHIVHTHTAKAGVLGRLAAWLCRVPITVHTFHGHLLHGYFSPGVTAAVSVVERALAWRTTSLLSVGEQVRDELLAAGIGHASKYVVMPPGIDLKQPPESGDARSTLGLPMDGEVVAFVGRLVSVKRPERFVEMARLLASDHPRATFVLAGEGPLLPELRSLSSSLGDRIRFLGWRSDVESVYSAADVVVLTSDNEGMPVSLIEAALSGIPAVTTAAGSASEVVQTGLTGFVTSEGLGGLVKAVDVLLRDSALRERMGTSAAVRARRLYSTGRLIDETAQLYETLLRRG